MSSGIAIPGSPVPTSSLLTSGGAQGIPGAPGSPGIPGAPGSPGSAGPPGPTAVSADTGNQATLGSDNLIYVPAPGLYNAVGNSTFEIDQRNVGNTVALPSVVGAATLFAMDRWYITANLPPTPTLGITCRQVAANVPWPPSGAIISSKCLQVNLTAQQNSWVVTGGYVAIETAIEGPLLRELFYGAHSLELVAWSSVAPLTFVATLRNTVAGNNWSLATLCTINTANTWTLFQLPNLPIWTPDATAAWSISPGTVGYYLDICLCSSNNNLVGTSALGQWFSGGTTTRRGAVGMSNWAASPVGSIFQIGFVQHQPGLVCTDPIDKPFTQNLWECERYFQKSYDYAVAIPTAAGSSGVGGISIGTTSQIRGGVVFRQRMAKAPTVTVYPPTTPLNPNTAQNISYGTFPAVSPSATEGGYQVNANAAPAGSSSWQWQHVADTGW